MSKLCMSLLCGFTAVSALEKVAKTQTSVQSAHSVQRSGVRGSVTFLHAVMEPPRLLPELALALPCCVSDLVHQG